MIANWLARVRHKVEALFRAPTYSDGGEETRIYCRDCAAMIVTCESGAFQSRADFNRFIREMRREARVGSPAGCTSCDTRNSPVYSALEDY